MKNCIFLLTFFAFCISCVPPADFNKDGGVRIVLEISDGVITKELNEACRSVIARRLDHYGIAGPTVKQGETTSYIIVEIPGRMGAERLKKLLQQSGELAFYETYDNSVMYPKLEALNKALAAENKDTAHVAEAPAQKEKEEAKEETAGGSLDDQLKRQAKEESGSDAMRLQELARLQKENLLYTKLTPAIGRGPEGEGVLQQGPVVGYATDTAAVNAFMKSAAAAKIFDRYTSFLWTENSIQAGEPAYGLVAVRVDRNGNAELSGHTVQEARKVFDDANGGRPQISLTMTKEAALIWARMTKNNIGNSIAIVSDGRVMSYPTVQGEIRGGVSSITGNFTSEEADDLVNILISGSMPATIRIISEQIVGPAK